ncbi:MAG: LytR C-terminal domain-containing protein [Sphingomicrobium sp.]
MPKQIISLSIVAALAATACSSGELNVRSIASPLAAGRQPANFRLAEGNAQFALGNVGLALEAYRRALREEPASIDAMVGLAACYDRMGRHDLSRRHYEMALATQPTEPALYAAFAQSLDNQGQAPEAARVKAEFAARVVAPEATRVVPGSVAVLPPPPAPSVTVALAPPRFAPVAVERAKAGVRLERLSMGEVALMTEGPLRWQARTVARTARSTTIRFEPRRATAVTLLNAARVQGLASRARRFLAARGFSGAAIGDAPAVRQQSVILYLAADRARAERIAAQFGFALERQANPGATSSKGMTILLGRDAARDEALAGRRA